LEAIWGPVNGFYVAAYAQRKDTGEFVTYAKVCRTPPEDYWSARCLFKLFGGEHHGNEEAALSHVRRLAYAKIACIPPAAASMLDVALRADSDRLYIPVASAIRSRVARAWHF
jgi:hypothetical protein